MELDEGRRDSSLYITIVGAFEDDGNLVKCTAVQNVSGVWKQLSTEAKINVLCE